MIEPDLKRMIWQSQVRLDTLQATRDLIHFARLADCNPQCHADESAGTITVTIHLNHAPAMYAAAGEGAQTRSKGDPAETPNPGTLPVAIFGEQVKSTAARLAGAEPIGPPPDAGGPTASMNLKPAPAPDPDLKAEPYARHPNRNGEPWTEAEDDRVIEMVLAGRTMPEVAKALGRTAAAVSYRIQSRLKPAIAEARAEAEKDEPEDAEPAPPAPPPAQESHPEPFTGAGTKSISARIDALGNYSGWTPTRDLELARMLTSGWKADAVAEALHVTRDQVVARFRALLPDPTIDRQRQLLAELERRATALGETKP